MERESYVERWRLVEQEVCGCGWKGGGMINKWIHEEMGSCCGEEYCNSYDGTGMWKSWKSWVSVSISGD